MLPTKAYAAKAPKGALEPWSFERRAPGDSDVVIDIKFCGICHSDIHQVKEEWGKAIFPMVPGHEIAGLVRAVGSKVTKFKVGEPAGVGCFVDSCRTCEMCKGSLDQYCLDGNTQTYNCRERDGKTPTYGGYSNVIVVNEDYVLHIPQSLPLDKAAPLLCAGITLYSPLMHWKAGPGKSVGIMGLGGLGHMGVKIAVALGAEVTVISHSDKKREDAKKMGAQHFLNTKEDAAMKAAKRRFDLIINTVSADIDINPFFDLLKVDGNLVIVGAPEKPLSISPFALIIGRKSFAGSVIGSIKETQEMLDFCAKHKVMPDIELVTPQQINDAYKRVVDSDVRYRFVIDISKL